MLACNLSPLQLRDPALPAMVAGVLAETGFPAARLELEVTESALVGDLALARGLLEQIKALGVKLALDDFGTGYSSLRHLQLLPFDKLKVDQSFVGAMTADKESAKIVSAVVGLGHSLGLSVVAEGVETEEVAALLRELGCDVGQGWLFGRPVPAHRIDAMVAVSWRGGRDNTDAGGMTPPVSGETALHNRQDTAAVPPECILSATQLRASRAGTDPNKLKPSRPASLAA